jgi:hypothetical protein
LNPGFLGGLDSAQKPQHHGRCYQLLEEFLTKFAKGGLVFGNNREEADAHFVIGLFAP